MKYSQVIAGIVLGMFVGHFVFHSNKIKEVVNTRFVNADTMEKREGGGVLTNPLLECMGVDDNQTVKELNISKSELNKYIESIKTQGKTDFISVYVRDLNNGPWIGINEREEFIGASLLKVPVLVSYMKKVQYDKGLLYKKIDYKQKIDFFTQYFPPEKEIVVGKTYTNAELLDYMIKYSDNNAGELLAKQLTDKEINDTFGAIGLGTPLYQTDFPVNTKTYAGFFRVLYNASYVDKEYSEKALSYLTQTHFDKGLTRFIPREIKVAHKFGIRENGDVKQFHDCGIVYYPEHPYLVCIMTRGDNLDELADIVAKISKFIYEQVDKSV